MVLSKRMAAVTGNEHAFGGQPCRPEPYENSVWSEEAVWPTDRPGAPLEGGDIMMLSPGCMLAGIGDRTTGAAVEALAHWLYEQQVVRSVIAVSLPRSRQTMHLDTVMTMVDHDTFLASPAQLRQCAAFRLVPRAGRVQAVPVDDLYGEIARVVGLAAVRVIPIGGDGRLRPQRPYQRCSRAGRNRSPAHSGRGIVPRPRRPALSVLPIVASRLSSATWQDPIKESDHVRRRSDDNIPGSVRCGEACAGPG